MTNVEESGFRTKLYSLSRSINLNIWTIFFFILLSVFYLQSYVYESEIYLAVTVARVLPPHFWIWTLLTFSFYNLHIIELLCDCVTIYMVDVVMFPSWKLSEIIKFCVIVQLSSAFLVVFVLFLSYASTFNEDFLWRTSIYGFSPLLGGVLVTIRQLTPNNVIANLPLGKFRMKHIAFTVMLCVLVLSILKVINYVHFVLLYCGVLVSWIYLRFYQRHSNGDIGDTTDTFKFSGFFPNHLEPPISIASNALFNVLVRLRICRNNAPLDVEWSTDFFVTVVETDAAGRQRQNALKALNELLPKADCSSPSSAPLPEQPLVEETAQTKETP